MTFTTALYNSVESYSNWLYRDFGEPPDDMKPRTVKNFFIRIYLIAIFYPVVYPVAFVSDLEEKYRSKRCWRAYERISRNPRTTRNDYLRLFGQLFDEESAAKLADDHYEAHLQVYYPRNSR